MRELGEALLAVARALVSYVIPVRFTTSSTFAGVTTVTHWEVRRGRVHPLYSRSIPVGGDPR